MIKALYHHDAMTDDMIIDYISRKATMSETSKKTDYIIEEIVRDTKNPKVLAAISNLKNKNRIDIYYNL
jgi:predicted regulator of amino acid metabolism with ACT domain